MLQRQGVKKKPIDLNYDALKDKFASYYFNSYGMKKHLKKLRKAIELQPPNKHNKQYSEVLADKLSSIDDKDQYLKFKIKPYQESLKQTSLRQLKKLQVYYEDIRQRLHSGQTNDERRKKEQSVQNFPQISKTVKTIAKKNQTLQSTQSNKNSEQNSDKIQQIKKAMMSNRNTQTQQAKLKSIYSKQRSNRSVNIKQNLYSRKFKLQNSKEKIVKHDEFMMFLQSRKQQLKKSSLNSSKKSFKVKVENQPQQNTIEEQI